MEMMTFSRDSMRRGRNSLRSARRGQYNDTVDIVARRSTGEVSPTTDCGCAEPASSRYAVLLWSHRESTARPRICIEIAVPAGAGGEAFVQRCLPSWKRPRRRRAPIAARSSRSMAALIIGDDHAASWSIDCRRSAARRSSFPN